MKCGVGPTPVQSTQSVGMLQKALRAQRQGGMAAVRLIENSPPRAAVQMAREPGKGQRVDVRA
jgi:hypothetical protein